MDGKWVLGGGCWAVEVPQALQGAHFTTNCDPSCLWQSSLNPGAQARSDFSLGPQFHLLQGLACGSPFEVFAD